MRPHLKFERLASDPGRGCCAAGAQAGLCRCTLADPLAALSHPCAVQVRKSHQERRQRRRARGAQRHWKLKHMAIDKPEEAAAASGRGRRAAGDPRAGDLERFMEVLRPLPSGHRRAGSQRLTLRLVRGHARPLKWAPATHVRLHTQARWQASSPAAAPDAAALWQELEEDPEMRAKIALYKNAEHSAPQGAVVRQAAMTDDDEDGDFSEVLLHELVDEMQEMQLEEGADEDEEVPEHDDDSMGGA